MFSSLQIAFVIILTQCQVNILLGLELKPSKGETCSSGGPSTDDNDDEEPCFKDGLYKSSDIRLTKRDGVALGHVQNIEVEEGLSVDLTTRSLKPLLFEIPDFLSGEECDHMVKLAKRNGLKESETQNLKEVTRESINETMTDEQMLMYCRRVKRYDGNKNDQISVHEFVNYVYFITKMIVRYSDLKTVYNTLLPEGGTVITYENCTKLNRTSFVEFVYQLFNIKRLPYYQVRYSQQAWILLANKDPILKRFKQRVASLVQMSVQQIEESEDLQVVKYMRGGHYHAHYDSTTDALGKDKTCCGRYRQYNEERSCHLCRYISIMLYLNNVTEGGETAFPVADDEEKLKSHNYSTNLNTQLCQSANLKVTPVKGKAILWYNHMIDEESGKMGTMDEYTLHGGCDVVEGEKWAANLWISAPHVDQTV